MTTKWDVYYHEGLAKVQAQDEFRRELTSRAFSLLNTSIALIVAGVLVLALAELEPFEPALLGSAGIVLFLWCWVIVCCFSAIRPIDNWNDGTSLDSLGEAVSESDFLRDEIVWYLADNYRKAWEQNKPHLDRKVRNVRLAGHFLLLQAAAVVLFASVVAVNL